MASIQEKSANLGHVQRYLLESLLHCCKQHRYSIWTAADRYVVHEQLAMLWSAFFESAFTALYWQVSLAMVAASLLANLR